MKKCTNCGEKKELKDFYEDKSKRTKFTSWCRMCIRNRERESYPGKKDKREIIPCYTEQREMRITRRSEMNAQKKK